MLNPITISISIINRLNATSNAPNEAIKREGRVNGRRLTRGEYENTIRDLLGIGMPMQSILPEDPLADGFEKVAEVQQLSYFTIEKYLQAADLALKEAFEIALHDPEPIKLHASVNDIGREHMNSRRPLRLGNKLVCYSINPIASYYGRMEPTTVPQDGWYRIKLKGAQAVNHPEKTFTPHLSSCRWRMRGAAHAGRR